MDIFEKISQAKSKLIVEYPYFGTLASKLSLISNDDRKTFMSDGVKLEFSRDYMQGLSLDEITFILANGALHASLAHQQRKLKRSNWLWQMASDIAINDMLIQNGMKPPQGIKYQERFHGMYAEEIYEELKSEILRDELEYESDENDDTQSEEQTQEQLLEEQLFFEEAKKLLEHELLQGEAPVDIERFFHLQESSKISWQDELYMALDRFIKDDYVMMPPSKKLLYKGIYLPASVGEKFSLVIAIDTSGSVDEVLLGEFLSEVTSIMAMAKNYEIDILVCDESILFHKTFYAGESLEVELKGGGGTDFRPVFEFIERELRDVKLLLYFSDLEGVFPQEEPIYDVKWITASLSEVERLPFGEVIVL